MIYGESRLILVHGSEVQEHDACICWAPDEGRMAEGKHGSESEGRLQAPAIRTSPHKK